MKKFKVTIMAIIAVLFSCVFMMGCIDDDGSDKKENDKKPEDKNPAVGKVLILQAYGNAGDGSPNGVSHSFVELYNISDEAIALSGISLYFANGKSGAGVTEDEAWKSIALTGTIPAKGSYLILGAKHSDLNNTRYKITDNSGDINNNELSLSRRGFKVAVIKGTAALTVQNPFNSANGKPVSGYIDMVGAKNADTDNLLGFEKAPARNSASVAVRRKDCTDSDDNSADFIAARYGPTSGSDLTLTEEELAVRKPRNSQAGTWDPFEDPEDPPEPPDTTTVDYTKLKLNEVSGVGNDNEKFYELKNIGDKDIPLYDCKIYYSANSATGGTLPAGKGNVTWTGLTSQTIEAGKLYSLIGRNTAGSFTTGLTASRILIITLEAPDGTELDKCTRTSDTGDYAFDDKSFARIPDGTGAFYFATPTPNVTNGASAGLTKLPTDPPFITGFGRDVSSVTPTDNVTVSATVTPSATSAISTVVIKWTLNGTAQSDINMTKGSGNVYSAQILAKAVDSVVTYKVLATNALSETNSTTVENYTVVNAPVDYTKLVLNEISGNNKFVEIYNSGDVDIPMQGVKLQRNDGQSEWVGKASDSIPAKTYRLILFNSPSTGLTTNPAYTGWTVSSGISAGQILKVAIVDPVGIPVDVFIRGDVPLSGWGGSATQDNAHSYSRMSDGTWAYADPTPGAANGAKAAEIINPGYLTAQP